MSKEKKKTIIFTVILAIILVAIIIAFVVVNLKESGVIATPESKEIMKEFDKNFNSKERKVIYYASPSCSYCALQTPILETIAKDYDMDYYYLDVSKLSKGQRDKILKKLGIKHGTPTTIIVENGKVIDVAQGFTQGKDYVDFLKDGEMIPKDAVYSAEKYITFIDYKKYEELISKNDTSIIVVGQTTCSHCIAIKPALNSVAKEYGVTINYLNLTEMTKEESSSFFESLNTIEYNDEEFLSKGSVGTPLTLIIKDKKVQSYISGERTTSQLVREFKKLGLISE